MSANDTHHADSDPHVAAGIRSVLTSSPAPSSVEIVDRGRLYAIGRDITGLRTIDSSGLLSYWREDVPASPEPSTSRTVNAVLKRAFDVLFAGSALFALAPLFLFVAIAIKLTDRGPVFFKQDRVGKDGKAFQIYKFRSMYADNCDHSGVAQTVANDRRVMPVGAVLRRTSIDELPQLLNIVKGQMSVVGPRPHVEGQSAAGQPYDQVVPYYAYRHIMLPGLTGWAQANGLRGPTVDKDRAKDRVDHDVAYIQNFSFLLDMRIILRTAVREFFTGSGF